MHQIDTTYNMKNDANGKDPDTFSKTLNTYHLILWKKQLPNKRFFNIESVGDYKYGLIYKTNEMSINFSSDSVIHPYHYTKRTQHIISQLNPKDIEQFINIGDTIGGYIIFPSEKIDNKPTINTARGFHPSIGDRFDFTLECIKRYYNNSNSPLYSHLMRYKWFFDLFIDFKGYVDFFMLNDLVDSNYEIKFWLPFQDFGYTKALPQSVNEYLNYKDAVLEFVSLRNKRIEEWVKSQQLN